MRCDIVMNEKLWKVYFLMIEIVFYILLLFVKLRYGYVIIENVVKMIDDWIKFGFGIIYGSLFKMNKDNLI